MVNEGSQFVNLAQAVICAYQILYLKIQITSSMDKLL